MNAYLKIVVAAIVFTLICSAAAFAGGGRIELQSPYLSWTTEDKIPFTAYVHTQDMNAWSEGEEFDVLMNNPRGGDVCTLTNAVVDKFGSIRGTCTASTPGQIEVYVKSKANGDQSGAYVLYFNAPIIKTIPSPITNTLETSPTPYPSTTASPSPTFIPVIPTIILTPTGTMLISSSSRTQGMIITALILGFIALILGYIFAIRRKKLPKTSIPLAETEPTPSTDPKVTDVDKKI